MGACHQSLLFSEAGAPGEACFVIQYRQMILNDFQTISGTDSIVISYTVFKQSDTVP